MDTFACEIFSDEIWSFMIELMLEGRLPLVFPVLIRPRVVNNVVYILYILFKYLFIWPIRMRMLLSREYLSYLQNKSVLAF